MPTLRDQAPGYDHILSDEPGSCPACGHDRAVCIRGGNRRRVWRCCSTACAAEYARISGSQLLAEAVA